MEAKDLRNIVLKEESAFFDIFFDLFFFIISKVPSVDYLRKKEFPYFYFCIALIAFFRPLSHSAPQERLIVF